MLDAMIDDDRALSGASSQDGSHPRPQLLRAAWADLSGVWQFAHDDEDAGLAAGWAERGDFERDILVPFPPESEASGIGDTAPHRITWYSRRFGAEELRAAGHRAGNALLLHFGAVDYRCRVWLDGALIGAHEGGHTPFRIDIGDLVADGAEHLLVVRVEDDPHDIAQPRGKQDWRTQPHVIWYHRTSGIWQPVWLESAPPLHVTALRWVTDPRAGMVTAHLELSAVPAEPVRVRIALHHDGGDLATVETTVADDEAVVVLPIAALANGQAYEELLWSPEHPRLIDADVVIGDDEVRSYVGIRTAHVARGRFFLNDRPYYVRSVLNQGYWPQSHLAAPSASALREEVQLIKDLGFNAARLHQKFEDPRFLFEADRLGLLIWGEAPATFTFSPAAIERTTREWLEVVRRDFSHPSIVTWVPLNESWGVQHIATDSRMREFARALVSLTKALDPTRPVVSNDGWEQVDTDIVAIHDYEADPDIMRARYATRGAVQDLIDTVGPAGRVLILSGDVSEAPIMLTEFGGISFDVDAAEDAWGYSAATSADDFDARLSGLMAAVHASSALAGFCYTQLTDTLQETNGLVRADRTPKLPIDRLREIMTGTGRS
ncbi:Glycoside hydrolase family 2 sugar binding protein [uncultured Microbacterium sp.]|uniref:Glycoside hydrolase family 2 sugar binding protein n=2 Tax=uncultured Microbacterium sp. TaxID=191216 RepID=A0A1Y5P242_9MICO|nr:Glycoside hydrolase family 2 sugar binding protein [uncultured Microbacterium sp.]